VSITVAGISEGLEADPAEMYVATTTNDPVAAFDLLNRSFALGTVLGAIFLLVLLKRQIPSQPPILVLGTSHHTVLLMTGGADDFEAGGASVRLCRLGDPVNAAAGAIMEALRAAANI
jgi:hypothetical protein